MVPGDGPSFPQYIYMRVFMAEGGNAVPGVFLDRDYARSAALDSGRCSHYSLVFRRRTMKITAIKTSVCNAEMRNWVFVRVETDQPGLFGWGEATLEWKTRGVVGAVQDLEPLLIGRDPRDIEQAAPGMGQDPLLRPGAV